MNRISLVFPFCTLFVIFCTNDYNPFENKDNIDIKVDLSLTSIGLRDTFSIFSTESLTLYPTLFEQIDSFIVSSDNNRLCPNNSKTIVKPAPGNYTFKFSWNDTGNSSIIVTLYRSDRKIVSKHFNFYLKSSLHQDSITSDVEGLCTLFTPGFSDEDLVYCWDFGEFYNRPIIREFLDSNPPPVEILIGPTCGTGSLYVKSRNRKCSSPKVTFKYKFIDNKGPIIKAHSGLSKGDTIVTGDSTFLFRLSIFDNGGIKSVSINNDNADNREVTSYGEIVEKMITFIKSGQTLTTTIIATDLSDYSTTKTFHLCHSSEGPQTNPVALHIISPDKKNIKTNDTTITFIYRLLNLSDDTVYVRTFLNDSTTNQPDTVIPHINKSFIKEIILTSTTNKISVVATHKSDTIKSDEIFIEHDIEISDTTPPSIPYILINGKEGVQHLTNSRRIDVTFYVFDNLGKLSEVTINGQKTKSTNNHNFRYTDSVDVYHDGTSILISAKDEAGNQTDTIIRAKKNSLPMLNRSVSRHYIIGQKQSDTLYFSDMDGDSISPSLILTPDDSVVKVNFSCKKISQDKAVVSWSESGNPPEGFFEMKISLWDGHETIDFINFFYITKPGHVDIPSYALVTTKNSKIDTLTNSMIDMRGQSNPIHIDLHIQNMLKNLTHGDSIIIENAKSVSFSSELGKFSITIDTTNNRMLDTINVLVRNIYGIIDTAGRITVIYPPRSPDLVRSLQYWFALDSQNDYIRKNDILDWWINRVNSQKQLYSYDESGPIFDNQETPGGKPTLLFTNTIKLINYFDSQLGRGGNWPHFAFTAFFVVKVNDTIPGTGGALWSSSEFDVPYFALGVSKSRKLAILNSSSEPANKIIYESSTQIDTFWNVITYRSKGIPAQASECTIQMGITDIPSDNVTAPITGVSSHLMLGCANKHSVQAVWPGRIAEVIFFNCTLTDDECREVKAYLTQKHLLCKN